MTYKNAIGAFSGMVDPLAMPPAELTIDPGKFKQYQPYGTALFVSQPTIEDLRDLRYLLDRMIAAYEAGSK